MLGDALKTPLPAHIVGTARRLFSEARTKQDIREGKTVRKKLALFIINTDYSQSNLDSLVGPNDDLEIAEIVFQMKGYKTYTISNSKDLQSDIVDLFEKNEEEFKQLDIFQLVYSGNYLDVLT